MFINVYDESGNQDSKPVLKREWPLDVINKILSYDDRFNICCEKPISINRIPENDPRKAMLLKKPLIFDGNVTFRKRKEHRFRYSLRANDVTTDQFVLLSWYKSITIKV